MAGPSEVLVIADDSAHPTWVAADLIAQAEHGSGDESALLLTDAPKLADAVSDAIVEALADLPRGPRRRGRPRKARRTGRRSRPKRRLSSSSPHWS